VLGAVTAALGAGCGATTTKVVTTVPGRSSTSTTTVSQPEPTATGRTSPTAGGGSPEAPGAVPDVTGVRLDVAARDLERRGVPYRVVGPSYTGSGSKSDWTVCETNPAARTHLESGTTVRLIVGRSCRAGAG